MGKMRNTEFSKKKKVSDCFKSLGIDGYVILKCAIKK
jgi:hypothetical protein